MKLAIVLSAFMACSHAMLLPDMESKGSLQKRADSDHAPSGAGDVDFDDNGSKYIVAFKKGLSESAYKTHVEWVIKQISELESSGDWPDQVSHKMDSFKMSNFMGYMGYLPSTLLDSVKKDPIVDYVEEDQIVDANSFAEQKNAPWGIARISQRANRKVPDYDYDNNAGKGVTAYVIDSGIKVEHPDFGGRAKWGINVVDPQAFVDTRGHGTHVAGVIGSETYGVAKKVKLVAVSVIGPTGKIKISNILKGLEYAVQDHEAKIKAKTKGYKGALINMSFSTHTKSSSVDAAANAAVDSGIHVVVSAGNTNEDACKFSPSGATGPITVAATGIDDVKWEHSNFGSCVDVQAPGDQILS